MKPKIPKCTYCGQELTCYSLDENVWGCEYCGVFYRVYNGKPFPKLGWVKQEEQKTIPLHIDKQKTLREMKEEDEESIYNILNGKLGYSFTMGDVRLFLSFLKEKLKMTPLEFRGEDSRTQRELVRAFLYWKSQTFG